MKNRYLILLSIGFLNSICLAAASNRQANNCMRLLKGQFRGDAIYYAHPLSFYDSKTEARDVARLKYGGLVVVNPNDEQLEAKFQRTNDFSVFLRLAGSTDMVAVRSFPDGKISAGVVAEALHAISLAKPVIELLGLRVADRKIRYLSANEIKARALTIDETIVYLKRLGAQ